LVDQIFASALPEGSISALSYAQKLISVPVGVIFVAAGRAILPYLSRQASAKDMDGFKATLRLYVWCVGTGTLALSLFMIVLAYPSVQILFQRGQFSAADTSRTATILIGLLIGLTPMAISFIMSRTFSALGKTKVLMQIALFTVISNAILDALFAHFWQAFGIALATSVVYFCSVTIMFFTLRHMIGKLDIFTFPPEIRQALQNMSRRGGLVPIALANWEEARLSWFGIPYHYRRPFIRIGIFTGAFATGIIGVIVNPLYSLRAGLASVFIVILLRYHYILLILWVLFNAINAFPIFRGSNALLALTIPTLLLMSYLPVKQTFQRLPTLAVLFLFLVWVLASIGISSIDVGSFLTIWIEYLNCLAVGILTVNVITTRRRLMNCIDIILLLTAFISIYGIYGYLTKQNGIPDVTDPSLFRIGSIFGIDSNVQQIFSTGGGGPQTLALFLSVVIPLAFYRIFTLAGLMRVIVLTLTFVFLIALGLTFTRGAYISVPVSLIIMILFVPSRKLKLSLFGVILALALIVGILATAGNVPILSRFFSQDVLTLNGRTYLWQALLNRVDPTQLLGHGLRASDVLLTNLHIGSNGQGLIGTSPHNLFLGTLYDHGIIGLILLVSIFLALIVNSINGMRKVTGNRDHQMLFAVVIAILVSVIVQSIETNDFWTQAFSIYFWVIIALPFAVCWSTPKQPSTVDEDSSNAVTEPRIKVNPQPAAEQMTPVKSVELAGTSRSKEMKR
ncbi:MAG TPA: lipid II flippase MurJ, partial [Ktedonobacteraceae bacterium]